MKKILSYIGITLLLLLGVAAIMGCMLMKMPVWLAVLLSNVTTILVVWAVFTLSQNIAPSINKAEYRKLREQEIKDEKLKSLNQENFELRRQNDLMSQTQTLFHNINFSRKLSLVDKTTIGYVVRDEDFNELKKDETLKQLLPSVSADGLRSIMQKDDPRKLLYINKIYSKFSLGIDLDKIRYASDGRKFYLHGIEINITHNTSAELQKDKANDIDICWVTSSNIGSSGRTLKESHGYDEFKEKYKEQLSDEMDKTLLADAIAVCRQMTLALQDNLRQRYPGIVFVDTAHLDEYKHLTWQIPGSNSDEKAMAIITDMYLGLDLITRSNEIKELPE